MKTTPSKTSPARLLSGMALAAAAATLIFGCSKNPDNTAVQPAPSTTVGTKVDDTVITSRVKSSLLADPTIKSLDISVLTLKGEVQLTGLVDNTAQIDRAAQLARDTEGASSVKNDLKVKP